MGELLVADYSRKGFVDGRCLRLPTIVVRPGKPNKAASTFASSIIREPLAGQEAVCPVERDAAMYVLSPRRVVAALLRAMQLPDEAFGMTRAIVLPGITATVAEMVDALRTVGGEAAVRRHPLGAGPDDPAHRPRLAGADRRGAGPPHGLRGRPRPSRRSSAPTSRTSWAARSRPEQEAGRGWRRGAASSGRTPTPERPP